MLQYFTPLKVVIIYILSSLYYLHSQKYRLQYHGKYYITFNIFLNLLLIKCMAHEFYLLIFLSIFRNNFNRKFSLTNLLSTTSTMELNKVRIDIILFLRVKESNFMTYKITRYLILK